MRGTMRGLGIALTAALTMAPVAAQAMSVAEFLAKVNGLKAKGLLAIGSADIGLLKTEMMGIAQAYRDDLATARKAGRAPHSCPPEKGKAKLSSKDFIADLEAIPAAQRGMSMKTAFYAMMKRRFPC